MELAKQSRATAVVTVGATVPVFLLGTGLGAVLPPGGSGGRSTASVVFLGLALSVTALPVLARILSDRGLTRTLEGTVAMASAAVVDVLAWAGLAALTAVVSDGRAIVLLFVPYLLFMLLVVRPLLARTARRPGPLALIVGALLSAAATEAMGMHLIFGALLFGLVVPRDQEDLDGGDGTGAGPAGAPSALGRLRESAEQISSLLMPAFFVLSGLSVDLSRLDVRGVGELVLVIAVAVVGKTGGTYAAARIGRLAGAFGGGAARPDEHARSHGAGGAVDRTATGAARPGHVLDHGRDGAGHHRHDRPAPRTPGTPHPVRAAGAGGRRRRRPRGREPRADLGPAATTEGGARPSS